MATNAMGPAVACGGPVALSPHRLCRQPWSIRPCPRGREGHQAAVAPPASSPSSSRAAALRLNSLARAGALRCRSSTRDETAAAEATPAEPEEPERDEDGLYYGTYSTFFTDPAQLKGMVAFCGVLIAFFGGLQILSGLMLPVWFGGSRGVHPDVTSWDYWTKF